MLRSDNYYLCKKYYHSLCNGHVSWAVVRTFSRKAVWIELYGKWVENLHHSCKVYTLNGLVESGIEQVVWEDHEAVVNLRNSAQTLHQEGQVLDTRVNLNHDDERSWPCRIRMANLSSPLTWHFCTNSISRVEIKLTYPLDQTCRGCRLSKI